MLGNAVAAAAGVATDGATPDDAAAGGAIAVVDVDDVATVGAGTACVGATTGGTAAMRCMSRSACSE